MELFDLLPSHPTCTCSHFPSLLLLEVPLENLYVVTREWLKLMPFTRILSYHSACLAPSQHQNTFLLRTNFMPSIRYVIPVYLIRDNFKCNSILPFIYQNNAEDYFCVDILSIFPLNRISIFFFETTMDLE